MKTTVDATIVPGFGVANKNVKYQLSGLVCHFVEIREIFACTINVAMDQPLENLQFDFATPAVWWWDTGPARLVPEEFSFARIQFEYPVGGRLYRAWLFDCHNSAYHQDPSRFEVIAEKIDGVLRDQRCRIHLRVPSPPHSGLADSKIT